MSENEKTIKPANIGLFDDKPRKITVRLGVIRQDDESINALKYQTCEEDSSNRLKYSKDSKQRLKRLSKDGNFNCGRWQPEEHQKFIEAILKYGNEWKMVQKHVGSRSSTQARSHAQKFFVKMKKSSVDLEVDFSTNSIQSLHDFALKLTKEEYSRVMNILSTVAFEKKGKRHSNDSYDESSIYIENQGKPSFSKEKKYQ